MFDKDMSELSMDELRELFDVLVLNEIPYGRNEALAIIYQFALSDIMGVNLFKPENVEMLGEFIDLDSDGASQIMTLVETREG